MGRQAIINGFMAGELSPAMDMRSDLKGMKYGARQATNFISTFQGPIGTREGTHHFDLRTSTTTLATQARAVSMYKKAYQYVFWLLGQPTTNTSEIRVYSVGDNWNVVDTLVYADISTRLNFDLTEYTIIQPPGLEELYFFSDNFAPWRLYEVSTGVWGIADLSFTAEPAEWSSHPQCACFYQNRLYVAGSGDHSHEFWASKVGDFLNFTLGTDPDEAMHYELAEPVVIQWMNGMKNLIIGSDRYEYIVTAQDDVVMPGDIQVQRQSNYGSCAGQIEPIGNGVLYRSIDRTKLRLIRYDWQADQWVSQNLLFASEHFTKDAEIIEVSFHPVKEHIYCTLLDGRVIVGLYSGANQTIGWTPLEYFDNLHSTHVIRQSATALMIVLATYNEDTLVHNILYHENNFPAPADNCYSEQSPPLYSIMFLLGDTILATALDGLINLVATYINVPILSEIWDADAAAMVGTSIYSWEVSDAAVTLTNPANYLNIVTTDNVEYPYLEISDVSDFNEDLEEDEYYLFSCEAKSDAAGGSETIIALSTTPLTNVQFNFNITESDWTTYTEQFLVTTSSQLNLFILMTDISSSQQIRNMSLKKITRQTNQVVDENQSVVSSEFTTTRYAEKIFIGRPYTCTLETLPLNHELPEPTHGKKKRWSKAYIRVIDSYPVSIEGRSPANYTKATQDQQVSLQGWDREATITIVQDKPYKSVIAGVYGELAEYVL